MLRKIWTLALLASALGIVGIVGCSVSTPLTPTAPPATSVAGPDGSTLKVNAPTPVSPVNDATILSSQSVTLTVSIPTVPFASAQQPYTYTFELQTDSGTVIGQATTNNVPTVTMPTSLAAGAAYRWRARVSIGSASGPFSSLARFTAPRLVTPTFADDQSVWRTWFFALIDLRGVGPTMTVQALQTLDPDFIAAGVLQETNSAGQPRGRIYLPTGNPNNRFSRTVNLGNFGGPWQWVYVGGSTCEGGSC